MLYQYNNFTFDTYTIICSIEFLSFSTYYFRVAFSDGLHGNFISIVSRAQSRVRFGRNNCPRGRNFVLNWAQGEVGVSVFSFIPQQNEKNQMPILIHVI